MTTTPTKNDVKDAKVISRLIQDGRYSEPHLPEGTYAELREGMNMYEQLMKDLQAVQGRVHQWIDRYFPEYTTVFAKWEGQSSIQVLKMGLFPDEIIGLKKVRHLKEVARHSIGINEGKIMARIKIQTLMDQYTFLHEKLNEVWEMIEGFTSTIPGVKEMTDIKGVGDITIAAFLAETGDLNNYK